MKLAEMSPLYEDSARRIQRRMEELRLSLRSTEDPDCTRQLRAACWSCSLFCGSAASWRT